MNFSKDVVLSFVATVMEASGFFPPEAQAHYRESLSSMTAASVPRRLQEFLTFLSVLPHEARVRAARALDDKKLPSITDMMIVVERDETSHHSRLLRQRTLKDENDYDAALDLLNDVDVLTVKQRIKLGAMVREYEQSARKA